MYFVNWNGFGIAAQVWAILMLLVACLIGLGMAIMRRDAGYLFVLVWSFIGIAQKQSDSALVANSARAAALFVLVLAIYTIMQRRPELA